MSPPVDELAVHPADQAAQDLGQLALGQHVEDDHRIQAVDEFGTEGLLDLPLDEFAHGALPVPRIGGGEPQGCLLLDIPGAQVGSHDDDRVPEVHGVPEAVGEPAVLEHLEQEVPDIGVGFFELVEEQHRIGVAADPRR